MPKPAKQCKTVKWRGQAEVCELCREMICPHTDDCWFVDGKTILGPWAVMCARCFGLLGVGLGVGLGQKYDSLTLEKIEG